MKNDANLLYLIDLLDDECVSGICAIIIVEMMNLV